MKKEAKVKDKNDILEFSNGEYEFEKEIENISFNVMVEKSVLIKKATIGDCKIVCVRMNDSLNLFL